MGLFGVRRAAPKDHSKEHTTPDRTSSPSMASSVLSKLFFGRDDCSIDDLDLSSIPTITTEQLEPVTFNNIHTHGDNWDHRPANENPPPIRSGHINDRPPNRDHATVNITRESIKRSISRKLARLEDRRRAFNIKDDRPSVPPCVVSQTAASNLPSTSSASSSNSADAKPPVTGLEKNMCDLTMSPVTPALANEDENIVKIISSDVRDSLTPASGLSIEAASFENEALSATSNVQLRRRPPPLVSETSELESAADWCSGGVFAIEGGFTTGGFHITAEGLMDRPELETRQDSDPEADEEAPRSERVVLVRALKEFRNGPVIGAGAAGRVYLAEHLPSNTTMAVKAVNVYSKEKRNQLLKELETLCTYISRYLVRFHGAFYDGSGAVHIALEYMDHGCLASFVQRCGPIPERIVRMIAQDCLRGLRFLHRHHVLHRDFKTANILLSRRSCRAKLSDFGLARDLHPGVSKVDTFVGTVAYMSPERLQGDKYTYASDVWALGVSLVECLIGRHPFNKPQNYFDYIEATVASGTLEGFGGSENRFSPQAHDFITECLYTDPKKRPQAVKLLEHPWIKGQRRDAQAFGAWLDEARTISMRVSSQKR